MLGASGYVGSHLVPRLLAEGHRVRASARNPASLEARWEGVEVVEADALDPSTLGPALAGVGVAFYLVHSMAAGRDFRSLELQAAANFAASAATAGIERVVYLGALVPEDAASEHIVSRRETGDVLRRGPVPVTELRAGMIVGPGSAAFEVMRDLVFNLPVMVTPRWVRSTSPPIALDNLLTYLVRLPSLPVTAGRVFDAAGPDTLTYEAMMRQLADVAGRRKPWILPVPFLTPELSAWWLRFVTSVPTSVARALIEGLRHDFQADDAELRRLAPQPLLGFREAVEAAFATERASGGVARWTEGAFAVRNQRLDYAYYAKRASGTALCRATPAEVWAVVSAIGGDNGYYYLDSLWTLRAAMDGAVGGPGLERGRRHPSELQVGDRLDSWKVVGVEPERRLSLAFGMKAPGAGMLEFELQPVGDRGTRITVTAYWHPAGAAGLLYWYAFEPAHRLLFNGPTREICRRARTLGRRTNPSASPAPTT